MPILCGSFAPFEMDVGYMLPVNASDSGVLFRHVSVSVLK
jgi:hypothetical protein